MADGGDAAKINLVGDGMNALGDEGLHLEALWGIGMVLIRWISVGAMVFGGVIPYIPQYRTISRTRDSEGFSTFVCLVLLIANMLRILFWFGKHFELPLLIQSIIMIATMLAMMHICVKVKEGSATVIRRITDFQMEHFWKWTYFRDYLMCLGAFWIAGLLITYLLARITVFVELLGLAALLLEACLGLPQLWRNYTNKSTEGMSVPMVVMWLSGDLFKTCYFILRSSPAQFWMCGSIQVMVDVFILTQVFTYRQRMSSKLPSRP